MKRYRQPKLKDGELRMQFGKLPHEDPGLVVSWQGDRAMKRDVGLLHYHLCAEHPDPRATPLYSVMTPSLIEQLEARGYDITTLKFSIQKKQSDGNNTCS